MKWSTSARVDFYLLERQTRACSFLAASLHERVYSPRALCDPIRVGVSTNSVARLNQTPAVSHNICGLCVPSRRCLVVPLSLRLKRESELQDFYCANGIRTCMHAHVHTYLRTCMHTYIYTQIEIERVYSPRALCDPIRVGVCIHVEYAGGRINYGILFIFSPFYQYSTLECVHIHVVYRVNQVEYGIRVLVAASRNT